MLLKDKMRAIELNRIAEKPYFKAGTSSAPYIDNPLAFFAKKASTSKSIGL